MSAMAFSNRWQLGCLFDTFFKLISRKCQNSVFLALVRGIPQWPVDAPHKRPRNAENVSMWWRHNDSVLSLLSLTNIPLLSETSDNRSLSSINQQSLVDRDRSVTTLSVLSPHSEVVSLHVYRNSITAPVHITAASRDTECKHIISMKLDISPVLKCCEPSIDYCIFLPNTQSVAGLKLMCTHNGNFLSELDNCWRRKSIYIVNPCRIEFLWGCI